ncbi:hypothetical protein WJX74_011119 [Apatococcus lobatus]|uniref:Protein kinase domain-containing protein n=1 Tax=Apatococcus lobatus TaxID=904363 RepID=A0AAW1RZJ3_9CHLO
MLGQLGQTWTVASGRGQQDSQLGSKLNLSGPGSRSLRQHSQLRTGLKCKAQGQPKAGLPTEKQRLAEIFFQVPADAPDGAAISSSRPDSLSSSLPMLQAGSKLGGGRYEVRHRAWCLGSARQHDPLHRQRPGWQKGFGEGAIPPELMANWDELEAFERESCALRALGSSQSTIPGFVEVFEEDTQDRSFYLVQELFEGQTLAQMLAQGWRASPATLQRLTTQLLQALQAMRQAAGGPISHNAITPDNIIMKHTPQGPQACLINFASAEQLPGDSESSAGAQMPFTQPMEAALSARQASHAEASSSSSSSWDVDVETDFQTQPGMQSSASAAVEDAQLVTAALSKALVTNVEYAAPEALGGEARMGASDAFSVGAVLAAAATGVAPHLPSSAQWAAPRGLEGTGVAAVIQRLLQSDWQRRLTPDQALAVLSGQPMPALPPPHTAAVSKPGLQGLAQRVLQLGRNARAQTDAARSQQRQQQQQQQQAAAGPDSRQPQGSGIPAVLLGVAAASLFLGPSAPFFLFTFLPLLAAGSGGPRLAPAGIPYSQQPGLGFQVAPRGYVSPRQQQQMLRMMLARQQAMQSAHFMQQRRQRQMWGGFH